MAIIGINLDRTNPKFTLQDFLFWMPQFKKVMTDEYFTKLSNIANQRIFKSIFGADWEYAMCLCVAHYMELIAANSRIPVADTLSHLSGGATYKGVMTSMSVGAFSKSIDVNSTLLTDKDAYFWNQTSYGASLMALYKTKAVPSIFVVTEN